MRSMGLAIWTIVVVAAAASAGDASDSEPDREQVAVKRFAEVLERQPKWGTAFDKVYAHHAERGTLDEFAQEYRVRIAQAPDDGIAWLIVGMIEHRRGRDAEAIAAFQAAEKARPRDFLAPLYLAESLVIAGRLDDAAAAYERAIERQPPRAELLSALEALGRLHQRMARNAKAAEVWRRIDTQFPDDARVQERIAGILAEQNEHAEALVRYEHLARIASDPFQRIQLQLKAAEQKQSLGRRQDALQDFERVLASLKPESWLYRDVRERIEAMFQRLDDVAGLAAYYQNWLKQHPDDTDAAGRLARCFIKQGELDQAERVLQQAVTTAPTHFDLRRALIDLLVQRKQLTAAAALYEELDRVDPGNPDTLRSWGQLVLQDDSGPSRERQQMAAGIWRRMLSKRPDDPVVHVQVAELLRGAELAEEALSLYQRAIELSRGDAQYREYLGEYLHVLGRRDEALAAWRMIADGDRRTASNLVFVAEILQRFDYSVEAIAAMREACQLGPEFGNLIRFAELLRKSKQFEEALDVLDRASHSAASIDERQAAFEKRVEVYTDSGKLPDEIVRRQKQLAGAEESVDELLQLAQLCRAAGRWDIALPTLGRLLQTDSQSVRAWEEAARIYEQSGRPVDAIAACRKLLELDRRGRSEHLRKIVTLERRVGHTDAALGAAEQLVAATPGSTEALQFYADQCFQLGRVDDGLTALRRAIRLAPDDGQLLKVLASSLSQYGRIDECVELYWRAFDKFDQLDERIELTKRLAEIHLRQNRFSQLVERLTALRRDPGKTRVAGLCLVTAYRAAGEPENARRELQQLLSGAPADASVLGQIVDLAVADRQWQQAIEFQQRLLSFSPSPQAQFRLLTFFLESGRTDEAVGLVEQISSGQSSPAQFLQMIDQLLTREAFEVAARLVEKRLQSEPKNWELLYRSGVALWRSGRDLGAKLRFRQLVELRQEDAELSVIAVPVATSSQSPLEQVRLQASDRDAACQNIVRTLQLLPRIAPPATINLGTPATSAAGMWSPHTYGQARLAASMALNYDQLSEDAINRRLQEPGPPNGDELLNLYHMVKAVVGLPPDSQSSITSLLAVARRLSENDDVACQWAIVDVSDIARGVWSGMSYRYPKTDPSDVDRLIKAYKLVKHVAPTDESLWMLETESRTILLCAAYKRDDHALKLFRSAVAEARSPMRLSRLMQIAINYPNDAASLQLVKRLVELAGEMNPQPARTISVDQTHLASMIPAMILARHNETVVLKEACRVLLRNQPATTSGVRTSKTYAQTQPLRTRVLNLTTNPSVTYVGLPYESEFLETDTLDFLHIATLNLKTLDRHDQWLADLSQPFADENSNLRQLRHVARAYVAWWLDEHSQSISAYRNELQERPDDFRTRFELSAALAMLKQPREALQVLDEIEPADRQTLYRRERECLELATALGDVERERVAVQRLYGLVSTREDDLWLIFELFRLELNDLAEARIQRLRSAAGKDTLVLSMLMQIYVQRKQPGPALELAHQILMNVDQYPLPSQGTYTLQTGGSVDQAHKVITSLSTSNEARQLVLRVEQESKANPRSARLREVLRKYYQILGRAEQVARVDDELAQIGSTSPDVLAEQAQNFAASQDFTRACEHFLRAFRVKPILLERHFDSAKAAFSGAKRTTEFMALLAETDLRRVGKAKTPIVDFALSRLASQNTRVESLTILRSAWPVIPPDLADHIGGLRIANLWWEAPAFFDWGSQTVIPRTAELAARPWFGISGTLSHDGDGRVSCALTRLLDAASTSERREALRNAAIDAQRKYPQWSTGDLLVAFLDAKAGRREAVEARLSDLIARAALPLDVQLVVAQELSRLPDVERLAIRLLEDFVSHPATEPRDFARDPVRHLSRLYAKNGRVADGQTIVRRWLAQQTLQSDSAEASVRSSAALVRLAENDVAVAQEFLRLAAPTDAAHTFRRAWLELRDIPVDVEAATINRLASDILAGSRESFRSMSAEQAVAVLENWLLIVSQSSSEVGDKHDTGSDLLIDVFPRDRHMAVPVSLVETALAAASAHKSVLTQLRSQIALRKTGDVSVLIASTMLTCSDSEQSEADRLRQFSSLAERIIDVPLPPAGDAAAARDCRAERSLWLVVRRGLADESSEIRKCMQPLADRAVAAAERDPQKLWLIAVLRDRIRMAHLAGDLATEDRLTKRLRDL